MRYPESKIKAAILHAEGEVRLTALRYFSESYSDDPTVMPVVIQAFERYQDRHAFEALLYAQHLPQTVATVDWAITRLRHPFNVKNDDEDNLRFALARILVEADPKLLARRHDDIRLLDSIPKELRGMLDEALRFEFADWPTLWTAFEELGRKTMAQGEASRADNHHFQRLMKAMTQHVKDGAEVVLTLLHRDYSGYDEPLMHWLEPKLVELAGRMKLTAAIPQLMQRIDEDDDDLLDGVGPALSRIGGDIVVETVFRKWPTTNTERRFTLTEPLECIHTDLALKRTLRLMSLEQDFDVMEGLAFSALGHFASESIEPVREILLYEDTQASGDCWDLRHQLVAIATIMGEGFPEYEDWHKEAVATDYGFKQIKDKLEPLRLADVYTENDRKPAKRIRGKSNTLYQIKIILEEIGPPIWRRLLVPDCTLSDLHEIIQVAMGWQNYHLYSFKISEEEFTDPQMDEGELNMEDATATMLSDVIARERQRFHYVYDFGDDWHHEIWVEQIGQPEKGQKYPVCVKGKRACPPEDVGGPCGYAEYLEALADRKHERHKEFLRWRGKFDSEAFDLDGVNKELRKVFR